jgi:hypothetical protein
VTADSHTERDRARECAVTLEQELADLRERLAALADMWDWTLNANAHESASWSGHCHPHPSGEDWDCCICSGRPCIEVTAVTLGAHFTADLRRAFREEDLDDEQPPF